VLARAAEQDSLGSRSPFGAEYTSTAKSGHKAATYGNGQAHLSGLETEAKTSKRLTLWETHTHRVRFKRGSRYGIRGIVSKRADDCRTSRSEEDKQAKSCYFLHQRGNRPLEAFAKKEMHRKVGGLPRDVSVTARGRRLKGGVAE